MMADKSPSTPVNPHKLGRDGVAALIVFTFLTLLSTLAVIARFVARKMRAGIGWDDWTSLAALTTSYGFIIASVVALKDGHAGYHITQYNDQELEVGYKTDLAGTWTYTFAIALPKISALIMYSRIFPVRSLQIWKWTLGSIFTGYVIAGLVTNMLELSPLEAQRGSWAPHFTSIQEKPFDIIMSIINIVLDIVILAIPQTRIWKLQMTARRKILISLLFLLWGLVCISSVMRTISLETLNTRDVPYTILDSVI
ncbi:hypothetical protein EV356DRAFT_172994 [Viridothelium virens]|uniref:Rhodopsin domain-containing protein n=1 Tax=Viridothelium virens TaxID=1048519 RepID=A0A6A6H7S5_VIRVR|nr:hypothetical protein EV356DRAFT_172994 [Viridothelium virens]